MRTPFTSYGFWALVGFRFFINTVAVDVPEPHPCKVLAHELSKGTEAVTKASTYQDCLQTIPYDVVKAKEIAVSMDRLTSQNTLVGYMSPDNPKHFLSHLEMEPFMVREAIQELRNRTENGPEFGNNFEFWNTVAEIYEKFKDYHVAYEPKCARGLAEYFHDYPIVAVATSADGHREIYTADYVAPDPDKKIDGSLKWHHKVTAINDGDPVEYLLELIKRTPDLEDPDARWNSLMAQFPASTDVGWFAKRKFWNKQQDRLVLKLEDKADPITVEWKVRVTDWEKDTHKHITDAASFANAFCHLPKVTPSPAPQPPIRFGNSATRVPASSGAPFRSSKRISAVNTLPLLRDGKLEFNRGKTRILFFALSKVEVDHIGSVGILQVPTFDNDDSDLSDQEEEQYKRFVESIGSKFKGAGVKKLIIDVSSNGGGDRNLTDYLFTSIFPTKEHTIGTSTFAQRTWSQASEDMMQYNNDNYHDEDRPGSEWNWQDYLQPDGTQFSSIRALIERGTHHFDKWMHTMSAATRNNKIYTNPEGVFSRFPYEANDIVVVTNGYCGSCCARFVNLLTHPDNGVRAYAYGGRPYESKMQPVGGTQGELVLELEKIEEDAGKIFGRNYSTYKKWVPQMPTGTVLSQARINAENNFYKGMEDDLVPLQYRFRPACKKLPFTKDMVGKSEPIYAQVADMAWVSVVECEPQPSWVKKTRAITSEGDAGWELKK